MDLNKVLKDFQGKAVFSVDKNFSSLSFKKRIQELRDLHKTKKSVSALGMELLEKNLAETSFDKNFDKITELLLDKSLSEGARISPDRSFPPLPAIATHDQERIKHTLEYARSIDLPMLGFEIQMLYGIRTKLQDQLAKKGYPVRVYVPYGSEWYPYFVRRLAERPANLWFFLTNLFRS